MKKKQIIEIINVQALLRIKIKTSIHILSLACQAPLSMGFSWQEYQSGLPFPPPGNHLNPGIEPKSPAVEGGFFTTAPPGNPSV